MITLEIDNIQYTAPEGWHEVSLELFDKITELKDLELSGLHYSIALMTFLIGCESVVVKKLASEDIMVLNDLFKWVSEEIKPRMVESVLIEGITYAFPTNLDKLSWGEKADAELIIKTENMETMKGLSKLLALLLRPATLVLNTESNKEELILEEYGIVNYEYRHDLFYKNLNMSDVMKFRDFFLSIEQNTSKTTRVTGVSKIKILK